MSEPASLFETTFALAHATGSRLQWSLDKLKPGFPIDAAALAEIDDDGIEALDALLFRFNSLFSTVQDHLFRALALLESEDISGRSNRDRAELMEKLGAIGSARGFADLSKLRNRLSHHYPGELEKQVERLNAAMEGGAALLAVVDGIRLYAIGKGLADVTSFAPLTRR